MPADPASDLDVMERPSWLPERAWPFTPWAVPVAGGRAHLVDEGDGPVLLLVHAGMWSFVWRDLIAELAPGFRCLAVDLPGSGLTEAGPDLPVGLEASAGLLAEVVDRLGVGRLVLVGHDLGGVVGLAMAADRPELIDGLVMVNTFAWPPRGRALPAMLALMGSAPVRELDVATNLLPRLTSGRFGVGRHLDRAARAAFIGPTNDRGRRRTLHLLMREAARSTALLERTEAALRGPLADRPALTVFGQRNDPFGFQARWGELLPQARHVVVPGGNHFPMCDDPAGVADAIREWWRA